MSNEIDVRVVPADNVEALDALDPQARELAVTSMLEQAASWLAHADAATSRVEDIANFKAYIATVAEASRRLKVSKECQMHAEVVVRRSERALGLSIRAGQERGEVSRYSGGPRRDYVRSTGQTVRVDRADESSAISPKSLTGSGLIQGEVYAMTDGVTDDQFDEALDRAQDEKNVSRANVVRKVREVKSGAEAQATKWAHVAEMAERGYTSAQIARDVGMTETGLRAGAKREGIDIRADRVVGNGRRLDMRRVVEQTVLELAAAARTTNALISVDALRAARLDREDIQTWVDSLTDSIKALTQARNTIKESIS